MTTIRAYRGSDEIQQRIATVRRRAWLVRVEIGLLAVVTAAAGGLLLAGLSLGYWPDQPATPLRWAVLGVGSLALAAALAWLTLRGIFWRLSPAQMARQIEQVLPEVRNDLINAILLAEDDQQISAELVQQAIYESQSRSEQIDLRRSVSLRPLRNWSIAAGLALLAAGAFAFLQPGVLQRALIAARPGAYVPHRNLLVLEELTPGDATVFIGQPVTIRATIAPPADGEALEAEVLFADGELRRMDAAAMGSDYSLPLGPAERTRRYAVRIGQSRWPADKPWYTLTVLPRVELERLAMTLQYPAYTREVLGEQETLDPAPGPIEAPVGTRVRLTIETSEPVPSILLDRQSAAIVAFEPIGDGTVHEISFPVQADDQYRLLLQDSDGKVFQQWPDASAVPGGRFAIRAAADRVPRVELVEPNRDITAAPGQTVRLRIRAADDYGLNELRLDADPEQDIPGRGSGQKLLSHAFETRGLREMVVEYPLVVPADLPDDGSVTIIYYASATDNRSLGSLGGPQTETSSRFKILVQNADQLAARKAVNYELLRKRLMALLRLQASLRVRTGLCRTQLEALQDIRKQAGDIQAGQLSIRTELVDLSTRFPFDAELQTIRTVCTQLARDEAPLAVSQAEVLAGIDELSQRGPAADALAATQDRIIDSLQTLLAIMPSLANRPAHQDPSQGQDLPAETKEKLRQLQEKIKEFAAAQKKIVEATERLSKKPVDDFTAEDDKLLKDLQAAQDKWEKFLNEAFTDLSKMAEQDFSNPSMLKELVSIKTDVTMAKDALAAKATEIATAAEENGIENAESLTANIEKWL
ncbi:MAG: hypothetical protein ACOCZE_13195, partial [Planctomycetota bacterium]